MQKLNTTDYKVMEKIIYGSEDKKGIEEIIKAL